ncbi:unnamed protein product [Soboliphyme baturini]|uniref:Eukaryotic translation initiation factor 3 subunit A n=1 Tax=Soboliphyme baturini TaxID=241478 RepID=A0A183IJD6_9BILA|nr:unnamed protein product [Soboliphyme baturini]
MVQWQKPENALQRANELLNVGKKMHALETLHEVINAPKHRTWSKTHEVIMGKHLELCVELRKPQMAKDALFQYRRICQQVNVKSLEDVILAFLEQAEKKAEEAKQESHGMVEEVAEDLDQAESPEKLLLAAVSGEGAQDRADRSVLSPWLRFLWESYRQCLELLRNNIQMELLYHKVAKLAFQFCLKYQRKAEFRKLCDNLRAHLTQIQKSPQTHYNVKLSNPETIMLHQDTRLYQLDIAIQLESWQEAIRTTDDIQQLIYFSKRLLKPQSQASYYEKLSSIYWKANNKLFHAAALLKLFQTFRDWKKNWVEKSDSDLARHLDMEEAQLEHQRHLSNLLSLAVPPTRRTLLKELLRLNINFYAIKPAQELYRYLEIEFCPLELSQKIIPVLEEINDIGKPELVQYLSPIKETAALKIMKQTSQIYKAISFDRMLSIIPFFDQFYLEKLIVFAGKRNLIQVNKSHICPGRIFFKNT